MVMLLRSLAVWVLGGMIARLLVGAGVTLLTASFLGGLAEDMLAYAVQALGQGGVPFQILLLTGIGQGVSIIGSAILTRLSIVAGARVIGIKIGS